VPPLILQPLLENAVRHGIAGLVAGGEVALTTRVAGGFLAIEIENPRDGEAPAPAGEGVGLANVRERLRALYGDAGRLQITRARDRFRVEIAIPIRPAPRAEETDDDEHG
jgi:LytS/YehU family sensor histidine kinase